MTKTELEKRLQKLEIEKAARNIQQSIEIKGNEIHFFSGAAPYMPAPTLNKLHDDDGLVRLIIGPYRSGKSVGCCAEIILRACKMPACIDGIRRCRVGIIRNTYADLQDTVLQTWWDWFGSIGLIESHKHPRIHHKYRFNDGNGIVELELLFLALDRDKDIRKLKSLEVTFIYVNEFSEIPFGFLSHFIGRTGCYPAPIQCKESYWHGVILDSNAPNIRHPIKQVFEIERPEGYVFYHQPPGVIKEKSGYITNEEAENIQNLPHNYYLDLIKGATEEFIKVYAMGQYGSVFTGKCVYPDYNDDLHSVNAIEIIDNSVVYVYIDPGTYTPAILVCQVYDGQLRGLHEFTTQQMGTIELATRFLLPYLRNNFNDFGIEVYRDPAMALQTVDELEELGLPSMPAITNDLEPRIDAVEWYLNRMSGGKPSLIIDRQGCPMLREGFQGGYNYKRITTTTQERYRPEPDKNIYSHVHDCLQYAALKGANWERMDKYEEYEEWDERDENTRNKVTGY
jgi:hypothetical protein